MGTTRHDDGASGSSLTLERYRLGELSPEAHARLEHVLASDDGVRRRLDVLDEADAVARQAYPPAELAADVGRVLRRATASGPPRRGVRRVPLAVASVAVALLVGRALPWPNADPGVVDGDADRVKGADASLVVYRNTEAGGEPLADDAVARPGDVVRIGYRVTAPAYGIIVSVDGRGDVTQHLPPSGNHAIALAPGSTVLLDTAFELDDAPLAERFFLVSAAHRFDVGTVTDAIRRGSSEAAPPSALPHLPSTLTATTLTLRKDLRP